ncbi:hypothetical protein C4571_03410 [Candidatus Parcubacteria bacterium]|nr:MAG: hypothetical protein C4571_03410 [Candidatus Parcubacteria bacterium]
MAEKFLQRVLEGEKPLSPAGERLRYAGTKEWRESLGKKRKPLLNLSQLEKLYETHEKEKTRLGRAGVIEKMMRGIPDVSEQLHERARRELIQEIQDYIQFLEEGIEIDELLKENLEMKLEEEQLLEEDAKMAKREIEKYTKSVAEARNKIRGLQAQLGTKQEPRKPQ